MADTTEKPKKADEQPQPKPDAKPAIRQLNRSELEALRKELQSKFHR
jgi:hypothetical protein